MPNSRVLSGSGAAIQPIHTSWGTLLQKRKEKADILLSYNISALLLAAADELNSLWRMAVPLESEGDLRPGRAGPECLPAKAWCLVAKSNRERHGASQPACHAQSAGGVVSQLSTKAREPS